MTSHNRFLVREARTDDARAIGHIQKSSWQTTYVGIIHQSYLDSIDLEKRTNGATLRIQSPDIYNLVLVDAGSESVVGFADIGANREKAIDVDGELYAIYLLKESQGRGGGRLLFESSKAAAVSRGYTKLLISVLEKNIQTCGFYEKMGAILVGSDHVDIETFRYPTSTYILNL